MTDPNATIILMEDDAVFRDLLADGLRDARYTVVEAATGAKAQAALAATEGLTILVADRAVDAEGPNGFQLASEALERFPELRVIYISGTHIAVRRRTLGERERALLKPFAMSQLLTAVRELGG
ncbi:response regulator [Acidisphaera sp. L21]|uniref:response regulator n=1 Tax=Acidisphaera sp. L21 TaxID=1641851 RepID=UPI00131E7D31|nr:response regulator [Acidisphaera sp. L21]